MGNPDRSLIALGLLAAMVVLGAGPVVAGTVRVADDTYIRFDDPTSSFGDDKKLTVRNDILGSERHSFVRFDLSTLPPGLPVPVSQAILTLFADKVDFSGSITLHVVLAAWDEDTVTEDTKPLIGLAFATLPLTMAANEGEFLTVNITTVVNAWLDGTTANNGIAVLPSGGILVELVSKERRGNAPELEIAFFGPPGPVGATGATGATGAIGAIGPIGPAGADGADGATGATGAIGAIGPIGPAGADGADGATGPAGADGADGATGPAGADGATGPAGADGATGPAGPAGPAGTDGATGPAGPAGPAGTDGATGPAGPAGPTGPAGPIGPVGPSGSQDPPLVAPKPTVSGVVNGASFINPTTAGLIGSIFGTSLAFPTLVAESVPLPTSLGGSSVQIDGVAAPLFFVSPGQINFQVPWELLGQTQASITVTSNGVMGDPHTINLALFDPGIFATNAAGTGQGAILITATGEVAAPSGSIPGRAARPASLGEFISIFCTGLGAVTNQPATGAPAPANPLSMTTAIPSVTIGGVPGTVSFSGLAPGFVGLYQVNVQVPGNAPTGDAVELVLTIAGVTSNTVTIAVQ